MSAEARLARLEGALSPKAATLLWLTDAHRFPTLAAYVGWLVDQPAEAAPFWRVPEQAETAVRAAMRGEPRTAVQEARRQAVRDAVSLVELVIRLNIAAEETLRMEALRNAVLYWRMRALSAEASLAGASASRQARTALAPRWRTWSTDVTAHVTGLYAAAEIRVHLERQYLDGHPARSRRRSRMGRACARVPSDSLVWVTAFRRCSRVDGAARWSTLTDSARQPEGTRQSWPLSWSTRRAWQPSTSWGMGRPRARSPLDDCERARRSRRETTSLPRLHPHVGTDGRSSSRDELFELSSRAPRRQLS